MPQIGKNTKLLIVVADNKHHRIFTIMWGRDSLNRGIFELQNRPGGISMMLVQNAQLMLASGERAACHIQRLTDLPLKRSSTTGMVGMVMADKDSVCVPDVTLFVLETQLCLFAADASIYYQFGVWGFQRKSSCRWSRFVRSRM